MEAAAISSRTMSWEHEGLALLFANKAGLPLPIELLTRPIGGYYQHFVNRLFTYLVLAAGLVCGTLPALGLAGSGPFSPIRLPLACTLALYVAAVFTLSHVLMDWAAHQFRPRRLAYGSRSVGGHWIVLFAGLALGFGVHQAALPEILGICGQDPSVGLPISLVQAPLCCATFYACVLTVPMSRQPTAPDAPAGVSRREAALPPAKPAPPAAGRARPAKIDFRADGRRVEVLVHAISHVSMEDHYCRIHFQDGQAGRTLLVRETMNQLSRRLESAGFLRIHRSHLVNQKWVRAYKRKGRSHWLLLGPGRTPLPVSRRRQAEVKAALGDHPVL